MFSADDRYRGGMTTLERYGREYYARISKGRKRRLRYTPRKSAVAGNQPEKETE